MSPEQFKSIKQKIEQSSILSPSEKKEWLFLLPRMTAEEIKELDRMLSLNIPAAHSAPAAAAPVHSGSPRHHFWSDLRKRPEQNMESRISNIEKRTPPQPSREATAGTAPPSRVQAGDKPKQQIPQPPYSTFNIPHSIRRPDIIPKHLPPTETASLTTLSVTDLKKAPSVYIFLETLNETISAMLAKNISVDVIHDAYEKSPLHKAYLTSGIKLLSRQKSEALTREEFEALTDFRTSLKKL